MTADQPGPGETANGTGLPRPAVEAQQPLSPATDTPTATTATDSPSAAAATAGPLAGLAREVEQLRREQADLGRLAGRVAELGELLTRLADTVGAQRPAQPATAAPCWLDHPSDPGHDPAGSHAAVDAAKLLTTLAAWVAGVYLRYSDARAGLPECWLRHPDLVEELLWLHRAWLAAYTDGAPTTAVGDWHDRQRPGVVARIRAYAGTCSLEAHRPGDDQHQLPPTAAAAADAVEVIAGWWATARDQPAPAPTDDQLAAAHDRPRRTRR